MSTTRTDFAFSLKEFIKRHNRFIISGHIRPDGDSVGACATMCYLLQNLGKEAYVNLDGDAKRYTSLVEPFPIIGTDVQSAQLRDFAFIMLDCSEPGRTGSAEEFLMRAKSSLCIDHHLTPASEDATKAATDFYYDEPDCSSASELLGHLINLCGFEMDARMAEALYMGICFDTGGFRHSSTSSDTMRLCADLMDKGARATETQNALFHSVTFSAARGLALAIRKSKVYDGPGNTGILLCALTIGDVFEISTHMQELDGVVGELNEIQEAEVALFLREQEDGLIRVNMRSKRFVNVQAVASCYGGGGHVRAAGCTLPGPMLYAKEQLLATVKAQIERDLA